MIKSQGSRPAFSLVIAYLPLMLVLACPFFFRYDFSKGNLLYYDFLSMNGGLPWFAIAVTAAIVAAVWKKNDVGLPSLMGVVLLFSVMEVAVNYPSLIPRDVFLQGAGSKAIIENGHIGDTRSLYPKSNPGFFLLWSMFSIVTGMDLFPSNLLVLLPVAVTLAVVVLFLIFRKISLGYPGAVALLAFLLVNFNQNEFTFVHFNTRLLSLIYTLIFVFLLAGKKHSRSIAILLLMTYGSLVISHVLNSLVPAIFLVIYMILERKARQGLSILLACSAIYIAWGVYVSYLVIGIESLLSYPSLLALETISAWSPTAPTQQPMFGVILGTYYKVLLIALASLSLYAFVIFRKLGTVRFLGAYLFSSILIYASTFPFLGSISINRGLIFASVSLAGLPMLLYRLLTKVNSNGAWRHRIPALILLVLLVPQFVLVHQLPVARYEQANLTSATVTFVLSHRNDQPLFTLGDFPTYYSFYDPYFKDYHNLGTTKWQSLDTIYAFYASSPDTSLKVLDYRMVIAWAMLGHESSYDEALNQWQTEVYVRLDQRYNRIYDNGFGTIYV